MYTKHDSSRCSNRRGGLFHYKEDGISIITIPLLFPSRVLVVGLKYQCIDEFLGWQLSQI